MMKTMLVLLALVIPLTQVSAETTPSPIQKVQEKSVFKGLMYKVWNKFRAISPKNETRRDQKTAATAGIRGAETTGSILQPYWKDDRTSDKQFILQLETIARAQQLVDKGELKQAQQEYTGFMSRWPDSDLQATAQFGLAMVLAGAGDKTQSVVEFERFIGKNPQHPLIDDAKQVMATLK